MSDAKQNNLNIFELGDLSTPWCLHVAVTLNLAEHISSGKSDITDLAKIVNCKVHPLLYVIRTLVSKGIFIENSPRNFIMNDRAKELLEPMNHLMFDLNGIGGRFANIWSSMLKFVKTEKSEYGNLFGRPFWDDLKANPKMAEEFDNLIGPPGHGKFDGNFNLNEGWDKIKTLVDIGGGTGAMLAEILKLHPSLNGTLLDLPRTVALSHTYFEEAGILDRVEIVGQSFFDPLPKNLDIYLLRGILNDWPDEEALKILKRCAEASNSKSKIVILKGVDIPETHGFFPIEALLCGGRIRTLSEFEELLNDAGLKIISSGLQDSGYYVIESELMTS